MQSVAEVTLAIAILGLVVATASASAQVLGFLRNRPDLSISVETNLEVGRVPALGINVRNNGGQPTTIMKAGFWVDSEVEVSGVEDDGPPIAARFDLGLADRPAVVMPGGVAQFRLALHEWPGLIHADDPLRAYAVDSRDRRTWGPAAPFLRLFVMEGWRPKGVPHPGLLEPEAEPRTPTPVEPRWKLWKDRELRKPSPPPWM